MKSLILAFSIFTLNAMADGFICEQPEHGLNIKVFNQTQPAAGTRNAAVMVLSDSTISYGRKTIASFSSHKRTLGQNGASYMAKVDLRVLESNRSGENILGTKLGHINKIFVDVDFNFSEPVAHNDEVSGSIIVVKRNGEELAFDLTCQRYLKN
jgi:hypothetical protein